MNNGDVFKMLERLQEGEDVLFGDETQISVHLASRPFLFTTTPNPHSSHSYTGIITFLSYFTSRKYTCFSFKSSHVYYLF